MSFVWDWLKNSENKWKSIDLKPCPFCGEDVKPSFSGTSICGETIEGFLIMERVAIECHNGHCKLWGHRRLLGRNQNDMIINYQLNDELIERWNTRQKPKGTGKKKNGYQPTGKESL